MARRRRRRRAPVTLDPSSPEALEANRRARRVLAAFVHLPDDPALYEATLTEIGDELVRDETAAYYFIVTYGTVAAKTLCWAARRLEVTPAELFAEIAGAEEHAGRWI